MATLTRDGDADVSRCGWDGHRQSLPPRGRGRPGPGRLRSLPGATGPAGPQLGTATGRCSVARCRRPHPRAPRPLRLPATTRPGRLQRARGLHGRHRSNDSDRPAGQRPPSGGGRRVCASSWLLQAPRGAAALHVGGRREGAAAATARRLPRGCCSGYLWGCLRSPRCWEVPGPASRGGRRPLDRRRRGRGRRRAEEAGTTTTLDRPARRAPRGGAGVRRWRFPGSSLSMEG